MRLAEQREALMAAADDGGASPNPTTTTSPSPLPTSDEENVWLVGTQCTVADLCFLTWAHVVDRINIDLAEEYPEVAKWVDAMMARPRVSSALSSQASPSRSVTDLKS
jgi:hypothetical protein